MGIGRNGRSLRSILGDNQVTKEYSFSALCAHCGFRYGDHGSEDNPIRPNACPPDPTQHKWPHWGPDDSRASYEARIDAYWGHAKTSFCPSLPDANKKAQQLEECANHLWEACERLQAELDTKRRQLRSLADTTDRRCAGYLARLQAAEQDRESAWVRHREEIAAKDALITELTRQIRSAS